MKVALVTGITGQDGTYLAELLLSKGYTVHGITRRASSFNKQSIDEKGGLSGIDYDIAMAKMDIDKEELPKIGDVLIKVDPEYFRPNEVEALIGSPDKAYEKLGWKPKYSFKELIEEMVPADLQLLKRDISLVKGGYEITANSEY